MISSFMNPYLTSAKFVFRKAKASQLMKLKTAHFQKRSPLPIQREGILSLSGHKVQSLKDSMKM